MSLKHQSTGNNDSVEDAIMAIQNIRTHGGLIPSFLEQVDAVLKELNFITSYSHTSLGFKWVDNGDGTGKFERFEETDE